jgi:L-fuculose-phosphate aldolase
MPQWSTREKVAISFRIHAKNGHGSGVAEQITASADRKEGTSGTQSFGLGLKEAAVK